MGQVDVEKRVFSTYYPKNCYWGSFGWGVGMGGNRQQRRAIDRNRNGSLESTSGPMPIDYMPKNGKCLKNFLGVLFITLDGFITNSNFRTLIAPMDRYLDAASIGIPIITAIFSP